MKISFMIHTASHDNFLTHQGIDSYFEAVVTCLSYQAFRHFEFIYIDTYFDENRTRFGKIIDKALFPIKHVPIHPKHRYWYDQDCIYIAAAKNTGILHAEGELIVTCDDAELFPADLLSKYWHYYEQGYYMYAAHRQMRSIDTENGKIKWPLQGDVFVNDTRVTDNEILLNSPASWTYAGTSFSLRDALLINGFNERMDGNKGSVDCDFGIRLELLGRKFAFDKSAFLYILHHQSYSPSVRANVLGSNIESGELARNSKNIRDFVAIENKSMIACARELFEIRVNSYPITSKHEEIIDRVTMEFQGFKPFSNEHREKTQVWLNTPIFNLKSEKEEMYATHRS